MKDNEQEIDILRTVEEVRQHTMQQLQDRYMSFEEHIARRDEKLGEMMSEYKQPKTRIKVGEDEFYG